MITSKTATVNQLSQYIASSVFYALYENSLIGNEKLPFNIRQKLAKNNRKYHSLCNFLFTVSMFHKKQSTQIVIHRNNN